MNAVDQRAALQADRSQLARRVSLVDLVDRLLNGGVVISGDITLAVADVDLLYVGLRALISSVDTIEQKTGIRMSAAGPVLDSGVLDTGALDSDAL